MVRGADVVAVEPGEAQPPLIVLESVDKHFGLLHVLRHVDMQVRRGEVVVVVGPSGSGKSTLCRVINRLEPIDSGMVFQSFNLFVVSHEMGFARHAANRVIFMAGGQLVEEAPPTEFFGSPNDLRNTAWSAPTVSPNPLGTSRRRRRYEI